jgi:signal recognition particle subunit SRP54
MIIMFDNLGKGLSEIIRKLTTGTTIDKGAVEEVLRDLRRILLQSDVDNALIGELTAKIRKRCLEQKIPAGLTLREHVLKVIYEELVNLLGGKPAPLTEKKRIMFVGLFGSGKTTSIAKLANYLKKRGMKVALVALDYHRPAAPEQLSQLGKQIGTPVYVNADKDPYAAAKEVLEEFKKQDAIIFDTAGRDALDKELADELKVLGELIKPDEVLLTIPADLGKVARVQSEEFNKLVGITGVVITKMDGTAKAGGALAAASVTGAKVKFIGTGERIGEFEVYEPERFVSRLLGLGDMQTLLEKAKEVDIKKETAEKIIEGKFTLQDFYEQIEAMGKMGSLSKITQLIPGFGMMKMPENAMQVQEEKLKTYKVIIQSLTREEKEDPNIMNSSRIKRVALGSGTSESDVRELLKQYNQLKKVIKMFGGRGQRDMMKMLGKFGGKLPF